MKARLKQLTGEAKELVQSLNDSFGTYNEQIITNTKEQTHTSYLDLSKL